MRKGWDRHRLALILKSSAEYGASPISRRAIRYGGYARILRDTPSLAAITAVAPGERFSFLDIFVTPTLDFASDFIRRTSSLLHVRRTTFLVFLATNTPEFWGSGVLTMPSDISNALMAATRYSRIAIPNWKSISKPHTQTKGRQLTAAFCLAL